MERAQGFAMQGARVVWTLGYSSFSLHQESAPYATITVYLTGTTTLATLYSDNQVPPTPMANPFTANANAYWFFYAIDGRYDVRITAPHWDWTIGDLLLEDPFRWTADQNANGHWLNDLGGISFINGACHDSIHLDASCNLLFTGAGGNTLMSLSPQGDLSIPGRLKASSIELNNGVCDATISFDASCNIVFSNCLTVPCIHLNNATCSTTIGFDPSCNVIVTGEAGNRLATLDQSGNLTLPGCLTVQCIHLNNGTCSTTIAFDGRCYVVVYGSLGVTQNFDVNGLTNLAGDLKVDGSFTLQGPWVTDQNANGHSLYGLQKLEVAQIEFHSGNCTAELQFDAACNLVLYGNMVASGNLTVGGTLNAAQYNQGGSPLDTGVLSVNGLKGDVTLLAGQGINVTATSQSITIGLQNLPHEISNFRAANKTFNTPYVNDTGHPIIVTIAVGFAAISGEIGILALSDANPMPGQPVARFHTMVTDTAQTHSVTFVVLAGDYYYLQQPYPSSGAYIEFWSEWW